MGFGLPLRHLRGLPQGLQQAVNGPLAGPQETGGQVSVTARDAVAINTVLLALYGLEKPGDSMLLTTRTEERLREHAEHLAQRAFSQLGAGVHPDDLRGRPLKVV